MKSGFAEKHFFKLRKIVFSHMLGLLPGFDSPTLKAEVQHANHYATGAFPARNFAF
jgi:hypothetical protein